MDVTNEILKNHITYGASDYTASHTYSSAKCFNYAEGNTIQKAVVQHCNIIPFAHKYEDAVGLFGAENHFIKFDLNLIEDRTAAPYTEAGWSAPVIKFFLDGAHADWEEYKLDKAVTGDINYEDADILPYALPELQNMYVSVRLVNKKTGNIYVDDWLDARLYTSGREEHPYELMYLKQNDCFYLGVHARNTRRLPYNLEVVIGETVKEYDAIEDKRFIMRKIYQ